MSRLLGSTTPVADAHYTPGSDDLRIPPSAAHPPRWWYLRAAAFTVPGLLIGVVRSFVSATWTILAVQGTSIILLGVGLFLMFKGAYDLDRANKRGRLLGSVRREKAPPVPIGVCYVDG